ncbi:HD domain-containing phosphohydrolase [Magnetospirillum sp. SS-4]|uniref:HD domain-containing phosphohydrolase n=1 Tax=Magnetospirillum sp. SS-4 TaxID=2681465 RepID=UPI001380E2C8
MFPVRKIISGEGDIGERVAAVHNHIKRLPCCSGISRIAIAVYDKDTDLISTSAFSDDNDVTFSLYSARLGDITSLNEIMVSGEPRVIDDLLLSYASKSPHSTEICQIGVRSSITYPIHSDGNLIGFLFFNSTIPSYFSNDVVREISPFAALLGLMIANEIAPLKAVKAAVEIIRDVASLRDDETGSHLLRMSSYVRLIATKLAKKYKYPDEWVDMLSRCAPLHDIGKITVPDHILHKPGKLEPAERLTMQHHVQAGIEIGEKLLHAFAFNDERIKTMMREVISEHHETLDGAGYPNNLTDETISVEARIVAIADIFDALTTERIYKAAWPLEKAIDYMRSLSGVKLDQECVDIFFSDIDEILEIRRRFPDVAASSAGPDKITAGGG